MCRGRRARLFCAGSGRLFWATPKCAWSGGLMDIFEFNITPLGVIGTFRGVVVLMGGKFSTPIVRE